MLVVWTNELIMAMACVGALGGIAFFLGQMGRKRLAIIPLLIYFGMAVKPLYQITIALRPWYAFGTFQFDKYSFIAEMFPFFWLPVIFMTGYYCKKGKRRKYS